MARYSEEIIDEVRQTNDIVDIIKEANNELIIIDNYADKSMLDMIRNINVKVTIICKENCLLKETTIEKYNQQYNNLKVIYNNTFHDRYIIIDKKIIYHCGTSLNHIGSKTFSINKLEDKEVIDALLNKIKNINEYYDQKESKISK